MADIKEEEVEFKKALANLQLEQSKFCRKINDLKALKHSVKDAVARSRATQIEYNNLEAELQNLQRLQQEYEATVNAFNAKFGWKQYQEAIDANKTVDANLNSRRNIKVNVEMLLRKVSSQLARDQDTEDSYQEDVDENEEPEVKKNDTIDDESSGDDSKVGKDNSKQPDKSQEADENDTERTMSIKIRVAIGLMTVIIFYSCLGGIIKLVQDSKDSSKGEGFLVVKL